MYETRFSQSFSEIHTPRYKLINSTRNSLISRTHQKLPKLNRSLSNSTANNVTKKLSSLDVSVRDLSKKVHDLKLQTRETRRYGNFLREDLGERQLTDTKNQLMLKINTLDKYAKMSRLANQQKVEALKKESFELNKSTIEIKEIVRRLYEQVDNLESAMGIYSAKEKHKI